MFKIRYWIKDFFGFPRTQVNGFIILLALIVACLSSEPVWYWWTSSRPMDMTSDRAKLDSLIALWETLERPVTDQKVAKTVANPFRFDPNNCSRDEFIALGFTESCATRIIKYREKGGKFRIKADVLKIYGIDSAFYQRIQSFITLPEVAATFQKPVKKYSLKDVPAAKPKKEKFDLNNADTSALKEINGIGEKLSLRILKYRDILGGFVTMEQLREVYGLDSLVINRVIENSRISEGFQPRKINVNTATEKQFMAHPYFVKLAKAIVSYRFQHGDFHSVDDIQRVGNIDDISFKKIAPYLSIRDDQ